MKDVASCDKLRGAAKQALIRRFPNRETNPACGVSITEFIGGGGKPRELKHLMYLEEEKVNNDSESSGERNRKSLNQATCRLGLRDCNVGSLRIAEWSGKASHRR